MASTKKNDELIKTKLGQIDAALKKTDGGERHSYSTNLRYEGKNLRTLKIEDLYAAAGEIISKQRAVRLGRLYAAGAVDEFGDPAKAGETAFEKASNESRLVVDGYPSRTWLEDIRALIAEKTREDAHKRLWSAKCGLESLYSDDEKNALKIQGIADSLADLLDGGETEGKEDAE